MHIYDLLEKALDIGISASATCKTFGADQERYDKEIEAFGLALTDIKRSLAEVLMDDLVK